MAVILYLLLITGCSFFSDTVSVRVTVPEGLFPWERYGAVEKYLIEYPDPLKPERSIVLTVDSGVSSLRIDLPKGPFVPVTVSPDSGGKPAGAVYPYDMTDDGFLEVSSLRGFAVDVLLSLLPEKTRVEGVNVRKIIEAIEERYSDNPWSLDSEVLRRSIVMGSLSFYSFKSMETADVTVKGCGGRWVPGNPFMEGTVNADAEGNIEVTVYPGTSAYLDIDSGRRLFISAGGGAADDYIIIP